MRQANAEKILLTECMASAGFVYQPVPQPKGNDFFWPDWDDFLGVTDMAQASSLAYRDPYYVRSDNPQTLQENEQYIQDFLQNQSSDSDYVTILYGEATARIYFGLPDDPSLNDNDSCRAKVDRLLSPPGPMPNLEVQGEAWQVAKAVAKADPEVLAAVEKWRSCMLQAGYQLTAVPETGNYKITPEEINKAVADVTCKESSGLIGVYIETLYAAERDQISQRKAEFDAMEAYQEARDRLAGEVLAGR